MKERESRKGGREKGEGERGKGEGKGEGERGNLISLEDEAIP